MVEFAPLGEPGNEVVSLLQELAAQAYVTVSAEKVSYALSKKGVTATGKPVSDAHVER